MAFNCPECGFELPGTPERTVDCFFCGWKPARESDQANPSFQTGLESGVIRITPNGSNSKGGYTKARAIIQDWHRKKSYRQMARQGGLKKSKIDSMAAALSHVARGGENRPAVLVFLGLQEPKVEVTACPHCGDEAHTYNCQEQIVKPKPKPRPKRKRRPRISIHKENAESAARSIMNLTSSEFCQELVRILSGE